MKINLVILMFVCAALFPAKALQAQSRPLAADEYIQSTSRLQTGGSITGRTIPGTSRQQVIRIAQLPAQSENNSQSNQTFRRASAQQTVQRPVQGNDVYPYPATAAPRTARLTPNQAVATASQLNPANGTLRTTAFQAPSPNNNAIRLAQNCDCANGFQVPGTTPPTFGQPSFVQVPPQAVPQGQLFVPGTNIAGQQIAAPNVQTPYAGTATTGFGNWWRPLVYGSGEYQPVVDFRGFKPGTYLGRGIIGQPTAYVTNQPLRNVMRYIFP